MTNGPSLVTIKVLAETVHLQQCEITCYIQPQGKNNLIRSGTMELLKMMMLVGALSHVSWALSIEGAQKGIK